MARQALDDFKIHVKLKLALLWASVMFCYLNGDYFGLFVPGQLKGMLEGQGPMGPATQGTLLFVAFLLTIPGLMCILSAALPSSISRWLNIVFGVIYTLFVGITLTIPGVWWFYIMMSVVEMVMTGLIVWYAWTWPKRAA